MASALYPTGKNAMLKGDIDVDTDTFSVTGVADEDYTYSAAHDFLDDVTQYSGITAANLASVTVDGSGVFDADDLSPAFSSLAIDGTKDVDALIIFKDTGVAGTSQLIAYIDLATPITPNGGNINITWDSGANKIFKL